MWKFVWADEANWALYNRHTKVIQKYDDFEKIENPNRMCIGNSGFNFDTFHGGTTVLNLVYIYRCSGPGDSWHTCERVMDT